MSVSGSGEGGELQHTNYTVARRAVPRQHPASSLPVGEAANPAGPYLLPAQGSLAAGTCAMPAPNRVCFWGE